MMDIEEFNRHYENQKTSNDLIDLPGDFEEQVSEIDGSRSFEYKHRSFEYKREEIARERTCIMLKKVMKVMKGDINESLLTEVERACLDDLRSSVKGMLDAQLGNRVTVDGRQAEPESTDTKPPEIDNETSSPSEYQGERMEIRVLQDLEPIQGIDGRVYELQESDVVSMPKKNAEGLLENEVAKSVW
jgi:DNA replication initiation complex subunit (GINS family)